MKLYYNQNNISSGLTKFFKNIFSLSKPHLKIISFILLGMISFESVVSSDIARNLKDNFSLVNLESIERRFRRFFASFSSFAYSFYEAIIIFVISHFRVKHSDNKIHKYSSKVVSNVFYTKNLFKTNIVVSNYSNTDEPWFLVTNDDTSRAVRNYSYRFGSIECITTILTLDSSLILSSMIFNFVYVIV